MKKLVYWILQKVNKIFLETAFRMNNYYTEEIAETVPTTDVNLGRLIGDGNSQIDHNKQIWFHKADIIKPVDLSNALKSMIDEYMNRYISVHDTDTEGFNRMVAHRYQIIINNYNRSLVYFHDVFPRDSDWDKQVWKMEILTHLLQEHAPFQKHEYSLIAEQVISRQVRPDYIDRMFDVMLQMLAVKSAHVYKTFWPRIEQLAELRSQLQRMAVQYIGVVSDPDFAVLRQLRRNLALMPVYYPDSNHVEIELLNGLFVLNSKMVRHGLEHRRPLVTFLRERICDYGHLGAFVMLTPDQQMQVDNYLQRQHAIVTALAKNQSFAGGYTKYFDPDSEANMRWRTTQRPSSFIGLAEAIEDMDCFQHTYFILSEAFW